MTIFSRIFRSIHGQFACHTFLLLRRLLELLSLDLLFVLGDVPNEFLRIQNDSRNKRKIISK